MAAMVQLYFEPDHVDERLSQLGLTREVFDTAAAESYNAFIGCSQNYPPTFAGTYAWAEANRSMRDSLFKWIKKNETNQPLVINESGSMAITSVSGDEYTGLKDGFPSTRSSKGERTKQAVKANQFVFEFMEDPAPIVASMKVKGRTTWLFLIYRDMRLEEIRYELSLPRSITEEGQIDGWIERIIFPPKKFGPDITRSGEDEGGQSPEINVEIRKIK